MKKTEETIKTTKVTARDNTIDLTEDTNQENLIDRSETDDAELESMSEDENETSTESENEMEQEKNETTQLGACGTSKQASSKEKVPTELKVKKPELPPIPVVESKPVKLIRGGKTQSTTSTPKLPPDKKKK